MTGDDDDDDSDDGGGVTPELFMVGYHTIGVVHLLHRLPGGIGRKHD